MNPLQPQRGVYVALSVGIQLTGNIERFLDRPIVHRPQRWPDEVAAVLGWGLKGRKSLAALQEAERRGLPYLALEDGFLRSLELGNKAPPLSLLLDDVGIYYDARRPSRLEALVAAPHDAAQRARADALRRAWCDARLSKYNHARELPAPLAGPFVLVVDQTAGDASIEYGLAAAASFERMLEAALDEHPGLQVVLKVHPDVVAGRKQAHFDIPALSAGASRRVTLLAAEAHAPALLEAAHAVYTVTSQMGFEALMWNKPVRTFGMPFYAAWGLTQDELPAPPRRHGVPRVTLEDLVHAALVEYPRYLDPETFERCEVERLMQWMALQRRMRARFPGQVQAIAFSNWKKPIAQAYFGGSTLQFVEQPRRGALDAAPPGALAVWGRPADPSALSQAAPGAELLRVEDGFLRSVGLGANWVAPVSWVIDRRGMYYDATAASDLEHLLQTASFDGELVARATALRRAIVDAGITKYNVGSGAWQRPPGDRRVVLVPGQVESDASITFGAPGVRRNVELLRAVREARPDAYLVYKPHPDVIAAKRLQGDGEANAARWCDEVVIDVPIHRLFEQVDELQVLTSLAGFEALLRGLPVVCHGSPFYAGWGLTVDRHRHPRRTRQLKLDELVAGALILYPTYVSRTSGAFTTPERALFELSNWDAAAPRAEALSIRALRRLKHWRERLRPA